MLGDNRSLPPTPEQYYAGLWLEVNALRYAISMPRQKVMQLINAIEQDKLSDEEYAYLKRLVEKRVRQTAQVTAVTRNDTVQHCSPCSPNPDRPSGVCFNLENNEGKMDQELEKLESSSADTGLETPGQQSPPNQGIWKQGRTSANGILTAGGDSSQVGRTPSPRNDQQARELLQTSFRQLLSKKTAGTRQLANRTSSSTPVEEERRPRLGTRLYLYLSFSGAKLGGFLSILSMPCLCVCFSKIVFFSRVKLISKTFSRDADKSLMYATGGQAFSRLLPYLKMARTSNARFDRSANALE